MSFLSSILTQLPFQLAGQHNSKKLMRMVKIAIIAAIAFALLSIIGLILLIVLIVNLLLRAPRVDIPRPTLNMSEMESLLNAHTDQINILDQKLQTVQEIISGESEQKESPEQSL